MDAMWYVPRPLRMSPRELAARTVAAARVERWRRLADRPAAAPDGPVPMCTAVLPDKALAGIRSGARARLLESADRLMEGRGEYFGVERHDMADPDGMLDPKTGRRAPADAFA